MIEMIKTFIEDYQITLFIITMLVVAVISLINNTKDDDSND